MIKPILQDDALLADIRSAPEGPGQFHVWWLGQSGFLIQWNGRHLLFDPYLSDSLTHKYAATDKPHLRLTERVIAPERLDFIDVVTSSHNHTDHLDAETLRPLLAVNPGLRLIAPAANRAFIVERLGGDDERIVPLDAAESIELAGFTLHALPAAHNEVEQDGQGRFKYLGYVATFGPFTVYHSGDTLRYSGLTGWLQEWPYSD